MAVNGKHVLVMPEPEAWRGGVGGACCRSVEGAQ